MSDENKSVEADANTTPSNANPSSEAAKYRRKYRDSKAQLEDVQAKLTDKDIEIEDLRKKLADAPGEAAAKIAELEGRIRTRTHKDAFARLSAGKIRPDALDDAFALSGWKVESDDVDEINMGEVITSLVDAKPYLRVEDPTPPVEESTSPAAQRSLGQIGGGMPRPATGLGRGPSPEDKRKHQPARQHGRLA